MKTPTEILSKEVVEEIYITVGQASLCWEKPEKAGVFQTTQASAIALNLCEFIAAKIDPSYIPTVDEF